MTMYRNFYHCPCGEEWSDVWDCTCNDRCPACNKEIEPTDSEEIELDDEAETIAAPDYTIDDWHYHEALDRTSLVLHLVDDWLADHPVITANPVIKDQLDKAIEQLADIYQQLGQLRMHRKD